MGIAAWFVYVQFIKTYEVGKDPKLSDVTMAYYLSGTQSADIPCLKSGWKLYLRWETNREVLLDVFDEKGELFVECEVFSAAL